jgi:hypothetical protein
MSKTPMPRDSSIALKKSAREAVQGEPMMAISRVTMGRPAFGVMPEAI